MWFYQTFCCCYLVLLFFLSKIFSFLIGLSSPLGPLGFCHLALPVGVCSLEFNNNNNNNSSSMGVFYGAKTYLQELWLYAEFFRCQWLQLILLPFD